MSIGRICVREVDLAEPNETVQVAAERMLDRNVGTLVVPNEASEPIGIITDRDLALRVVAKGLDPTQTTVEEVMTHSPKTVSEDTPIEASITAMRAGPYRRLPVVDNSGVLVGLVSLDDVLDLLSSEMRQIGDLLGQESPTSLGRL